MTDQSTDNEIIATRFATEAMALLQDASEKLGKAARALTDEERLHAPAISPANQQAIWRYQKAANSINRALEHGWWPSSPCAGGGLTSNTRQAACVAMTDPFAAAWRTC